jgi:hypothetical protein
VKCRRHSCLILMKLEFSRQILENTKIPNFMKIRPVGSELFDADGRTDITKLVVAFHKFWNAPRNSINVDNVRYVTYICK